MEWHYQPSPLSPGILLTWCCPAVLLVKPLPQLVKLVAPPSEIVLRSSQLVIASNMIILLGLGDRVHLVIPIPSNPLPILGITSKTFPQLLVWLQNQGLPWVCLLPIPETAMSVELAPPPITAVSPLHPPGS